MAGKNITRAKRAHLRKSSSRKRKHKQKRREGHPSRPDLYAILGRFSEALAMLECVQHALVAAEEGAVGEDRPGITAIGAEICTLEKVVKEIKASYSEFDYAILALAQASD